MDLIKQFCKDNGINNYSITNGIVDVNGDVDLSYKNLTELPIRFGIVKGDFNINQNKLTTLKGCPHTVIGNFDCYLNELTDLKYCPSVVDGFFDCSDNNIEILDNLPDKLMGKFYCKNNLLDIDLNERGYIEDFESFLKNKKRTNKIKNILERKV